MNQLSIQENTIDIDNYFESDHNKEIKRLALIGKNLDDYTGGIIFGLCNQLCEMRIAERGNIYFSLIKISGETLLGKKTVIKEIQLTDNGLKEIDCLISKYLGRSIEGKGHIYLVSDGEFTKIGATTFNPIKRLNELQVGNAKELKLIGSYQVERRIATESLLHDAYGAQHVRGEWFNLLGMDIVDILNNRTQSSNNEEYQSLTNEDCSCLAGRVKTLQLHWDEYSTNLKADTLGQTMLAEKILDHLKI